ncbi:MAG: geranylgeranylglycerol-phosphate geranylgeranyltransferase [Bacteroidota bacterium]
MKRILRILQLIRIQNLIIISLTLYLMRWFIIYPVFSAHGFDLQISNIDFMRITLAVVFIAAGGYVINDYFDRPVDQINHPEKVIAGIHISCQTVLLLYSVFSLMGIVLGTFISIRLELPFLSLIYLFTAVLLFLYSYKIKKVFLAGNIVIALLTAFVPLMVLLYEIPLLKKNYAELIVDNSMNFENIIIIVGIFSIFSFLTNYIREVIKDLEDIEGDQQAGRKTMPSVLGIFWSKTIVLICTLLVIILIIYIYCTHLQYITVNEKDYLSLAYFLLFIIIPLILMIYLIIISKQKSEFRNVAHILKFVMVSGLFYSTIFYFKISICL